MRVVICESDSTLEASCTSGRNVIINKKGFFPETEMFVLCTLRKNILENFIRKEVKAPTKIKKTMQRISTKTDFISVGSPVL